MNTVSIIECPRDAMQGWPHFIPTGKKVEYLNRLLRVGFDLLDFGSFVSPKAIPQMADTAEVLEALDPAGSNTRLLAIVANRRGAEDAATREKISFLGYPFSVSETFQIRNANTTIHESFSLVKEIRDICIRHDKQLVVYLSMGFGNPYGDAYSPEWVLEWAGKLADEGIRIISVADTVGLAEPAQVKELMSVLLAGDKRVEFGVHLHSSAAGRIQKLQAALDAGCRRFDGAIRGIGGCPMAGNELIGNMDTEFMVDYLREQGYSCGVDATKLKQCSLMAGEIFIP